MKAKSGEFSSVKAALDKWGRWAIRCEGGALGFAASCILGGGDGGDRGGYESKVPMGVDEDHLVAMDVDVAVRKLPKVQRVVVIQVHMLGLGWSERKNAETLGIDRRTMNQHLNISYRQISLDIFGATHQNVRQSVIGGIVPGGNQPVTAQA